MKAGFFSALVALIVCWSVTTASALSQPNPITNYTIKVGDSTLDVREVVQKVEELIKSGPATKPPKDKLSRDDVKNVVKQLILEAAHKQGRPPIKDQNTLSQAAEEIIRMADEKS